ncbi:MAG: hypothetical protein CMJ85_06890 [Planctomycetes bacterium]|jgi:tetratricopeptide (TPR) repeat protein|nr:hypothetical protein [Planctomycetota bacterium]MDP6425279.1 hypothetical protein [Planctomycetota bacterium]
MATERLTRPLLGLALGFAIATVVANAVPEDPLTRLPVIVRPPPGVFSLVVPSNIFNQPREKNEFRAFFVGASETAAFPYEPPAQGSYGYYLGAGYRAATGRGDIHIRSEGAAGLDSEQLCIQARKLLEYGDPSVIVLVIGANEFANRICRGKPLLPDDLLGRTTAMAGAPRVLFDRLDAALDLSSGGAAGNVAGFLDLMRDAMPGRPALAGLPIGNRDRRLLMQRLYDQIASLHRDCKAQGTQLCLALSMHGLDGAPPWCSEVRPGPKEADALCKRTFKDPSSVELAEIDVWLAQLPDRADLHHARARVLRRLGRAAEAVEEFNAALDLDLAPLHQTGEVRATLRQAATDLGLTLIDFNDGFKDQHGLTGPDGFLDYAHPDAVGHRKLARWLAREHQGKLLPKLPAGWEKAFDKGVSDWSKQTTPESAKLAPARMWLNVARFYLVFGNFREALPLLEAAAPVLQGTSHDKDLAIDLEFCRAALAKAGR